MASNSIASQLQAIKSLIGADSEPTKRPFTRPSILFDPKKAADINVETIYSIARAGLEALGNINERFSNYKDDLFSQKSIELDRELLSIKENNRINASISSYLRLLSGYFPLESALKTVEYLIRRYRIHVYNIEELILCALPYHDTVEFVLIVQLIDLGNSRWRFLDGVKSSGAPPPRKVIVQQCIRDMGILEVLCNYATPAKKFKPSPPVVTFCTTIVVEVLGCAETVDSSVVKRVLPFLYSGLQSNAKEFSDNKAGALMIAVLLANRVALAPKLVKSLMGSIAEMTFLNVEESGDSQHSYMSITALAIIIQLQSVETLPKKVVDILKGIRELPVLLSSLTKRFNVDRFLAVLVESLVDYSGSDNECKLGLISILDVVPVAGLVHKVVFRLLFTCLRLSAKSNASETLESGNFTRQILGSLKRKYPHEFLSAFHNFIQDETVQSKGESWVFESLSRMLDANLDASAEVSDSKIWLSLEHPKVEVRRAMLYSLDVSTLLRNRALSSQRFSGMEDLIVRRLHDEDLSVVSAALSLNQLDELIGSTKFLEVLREVIQRCTGVLFSADASNDLDLASDTAISCLKNAALLVQNKNEFVEEVASMIFPLLLVRPKTKKLNLKAQQIAKDIDWPFYRSLTCTAGLEKKQKQDWTSAINMRLVSNLVEVLPAATERFMDWLTKPDHSDLSKTLAFFMLLHSFEQRNAGWLSALYEYLKAEFTKFSTTDVLSRLESNDKIVDGGCVELLDRVLDTDSKELNGRILIHILWRLLKTYVLTAPENVTLEGNKKWISTLQDLYVFFAQFNEKNVFKEHLAYLLQHCKISPVSFLSQFINQEGFSTAVQVESLHLFTSLCSSSDRKLSLQLLEEFPSVLVPLSSDIQEIRNAAMSYVEKLLALSSQFKCKERKNGKTGSWNPYTDELQSILVQQKTLLLSDREFLSSLLTSLLSSSCQSLLLPINSEKRSEKSTRESILAVLLRSALKLPAYAKLKVLSLVKEVGADIMRSEGADIISDIESLLSGLLKRCASQGKNEKLSNIDVDLLCLLLEMCCMSISTNLVDRESYLVMALRMGGMPSNDATTVKPCVTVLHHLKDSLFKSLRPVTQEQILEELVLLYRIDNSHMKNATGEALLRINISCSTFGAIIDKILSSAGSFHGSSLKKCKKSMHNKPDAIGRSTDTLCFLSSLLDILLLKNDLQNRSSLIKRLFQLLGKISSSGEADVVMGDDLTQSPCAISNTVSSRISYIQQTILLLLEDIFTSLPKVVDLKESVLDETYIALLVECARSASDLSTRNHAFSLFTAFSRTAPYKVLDHAPDFITAIAKCTMSENDNHSRRVFENFITVVIPCWLSHMNDPLRLLQIFVDIMPDIPQHRRLTLIRHLLRTVGESRSFGSLLFLLFRSLVLRRWSEFVHGSDFVTSATRVEWEYVLAVQVCEQYTSEIWLPSLVLLLQHLNSVDYDQGHFVELQVAMTFILDKLQDPEFTFKLESREDLELLQGTLDNLMEEVVCCLHMVGSRRNKIDLHALRKKEIKELIRAVLRCTTKGMTPSAFFKGVIRLLGHADRSMRKKVLHLLCETVKSSVVIKRKTSQKLKASPSSSWQYLDTNALDSFIALCSELLPLVDASCDDTSLQLASASALEILANRFPSNHTVFMSCLQVVTKSILSADLAAASACLRTAGVLVNVLGSTALPELPQIMENVLKKSKLVRSVLEANTERSNCGASTHALKESFVMCTLVTLEALIEKLGPFLNPYLQDILEFLVLQPDYTYESCQRLKPKADAVRRLLAEKIPARLVLSPIEKVMPRAVMSGDSSITIIFEMLTNIVGGMDRTSVSSYHAKLFELFLLALDLRRQHIPSIKKIDEVEKHVLAAVVGLTMKLTETMFKPLFIRSIEWEESSAAEGEAIADANLDRAISFYGLVNKLAENHRSLFVPYFKYLRDGCLHHLTDGDVKNVDSRKKKKAKLLNTDGRKRERKDDISPRKWHLRTLVLSSLYKCFLYDTGSHKFLDSSNFQVFLKPIVSQMSVEPPAFLDNCQGIPSVKEVDDLLVSCIGQMAVAAGSDLLWKPLNYEVLMQTRNEMVRSRILGLRVIKYLVENLKEEYLVLLAETIPFLVELLEDVELSVKALAQDILRELELMSGESLKQYL